MANNPPGTRRYETAGRTLADVALRTAEPEREGQESEVQAKDPNVFKGYLGRLDKTASYGPSS